MVKNPPFAILTSPPDVMRSFSVPPPAVKIKFALDLNPISSTPPVASAIFLPLPKNPLLVPLLCRLINTPFAW